MEIILKTHTLAPVLAMIAGLALAPAVVLAADSPPAAPPPPNSAYGHPMGQGMGHGMGHDPERMHGMMQAHMTRMLDEVGASAEQKAKIETILRQGMAPMKDMRAEMRTAHQQMHALLGAPTIDRAALEKLRAAQMTRFDDASRAMVKAMADAAEVLTPAQRAKFAALAAKDGGPAMGPPPPM